MSIQYEWKFGPLKVETINDIPNVVTGIYYACIAKDIERSITFNGIKTGILPVPAVDINNFIPVDNLTAITFEEWINSHVSKTEIEEFCAGLLEKELSQQIKVLEIPESVSTDLSTLMINSGFDILETPDSSDVVAPDEQPILTAADEVVPSTPLNSMFPPIPPIPPINLSPEPLGDYPTQSNNQE